MKKYILFLVVSILFVLSFLILRSGPSLEVVFLCPKGEEIVVLFAEENQEVMNMTFKGSTYELFSTVSASGVRYESADKSVVFLNKGSEAMIEKNDEVVYEDCVLKQ